MFKIPLADLKSKILETGTLSADDLDAKIKAKINELSGLISEEGAAHIIANELGISLAPPEKESMKLKEIYAGMRGVSCVGKIVRKYDVREFQKDDRTGKVCSLLLGDETGVIRLVFWNEQVEQLTSVNEGDVLHVKNAYARENRSDRELHLGQKGEIEVNPEGIAVQSVRQTSEFTRKSINTLQAGESNVEVLGTVVQVFDPRFWSTCPECNKKVTQNGEVFDCATHGTVQPGTSYVMNVVVDDGTSTIRTVFWKNQTNNLVGKDDLSEYKENPSSFEDVKTDLLGEQFKLMGRVVKNDMFDRLEFSVQVVEKANAEEELARLEEKKDVPAESKISTLEDMPEVEDVQ
jgi:ssDNA-binding replication factor A large subunit